ncbi:MAG: O-antigen ligase family protein [Betaproteobacteria bacterium]
MTRNFLATMRWGIDHLLHDTEHSAVGRRAYILGGLGLLLVCTCMGYVSVLYGTWVDEKLLRIVLLPAALFVGFLFILDKKALFILIIMVRIPIDSIVEATRFGSMSAGAAMNGLVILIAFLMFIEQPRTVSKTVIPMWAPLVVVMLLATLRSPEVAQATRTVMAYLTNVAIFMIPFYLKQCQKDMRFSIYIVLLSSLVPAFYAFVDYAQGGYGGMYGDRVSSTLPHPNIFAFYLVIVISMAFYLLKSPLTKMSATRRWVLAAYICVLIVDLGLTKTRSAWAACYVMFLIYGLVFERKFLIYIAIASALALLVPSIQDRLLDLNTANLYWTYGVPQNSYEWRKLIWEEAWDWMKPGALPFGYGLGSFAYYSLEFFSLANRTRWGAHNVYVQWLFEAGVVGLVCAAWLYYRLLALLKKGLKHDKLATVIMITVVVEYLVIAYSDNMLDYLAFNWYFWFVLGTACSIIVTREAHEEKNTSESGSALRHSNMGSGN